MNDDQTVQINNATYSISFNSVQTLFVVFSLNRALRHNSDPSAVAITENVPLVDEKPRMKSYPDNKLFIAIRPNVKSFLFIEFFFS